MMTEKAALNTFWRIYNMNHDVVIDELCRKCLNYYYDFKYAEMDKELDKMESYASMFEAYANDILDIRGVYEYKCINALIYYMAQSCRETLYYINKKLAEQSNR